METEAPTWVHIFFMFVWFAGLVTHPGRSIICMIFVLILIINAGDYIGFLRYFETSGLLTLFVCMFTTRSGLVATGVGYGLGSGAFSRALHKIFD